MELYIPGMWKCPNMWFCDRVCLPSWVRGVYFPQKSYFFPLKKSWIIFLPPIILSLIIYYRYGNAYITIWVIFRLLCQEKYVGNISIFAPKVQNSSKNLQIHISAPKIQNAVIFFPPQSGGKTWKIYIPDEPTYLGLNRRVCEK